MAQPIAPDYGQQFLFPPALEDWVPKDHPARFLREFVDQLDLAALGFLIPAATEGRPPYAPGLLLKIWLYGYYQRIRSTRRLESACREHVSLLWLTGLIAPDHNSLWRFWRDNQMALREVFRQSVQLALRTGCVGLALQALDGTKIEACARSHKGWSKSYMEKLLAALERVLKETEVEVLQDNQTEIQDSRLPDSLAQREALREQIKTGLAQLAADGRQHYHPTEPEARRMKVGHNNRFAYNAQAVTDAQEGIIVACEVTRQETDLGQLTPMIEEAQKNLPPEAQTARTLADTGYGAGADLQAAADRNMEVLVPPVEGKPAKDNRYAAQHFRYDPLHKTVTCPQNRTLDYEGHTIRQGTVVQRYRCHCRDCPVRHQCTKDSKGRQIEIWPHTVAVQNMRQRLADPNLRAIWKRRAGIIERRFGQVKQHDGFRRWTVRGWEGVKTQWTMLCTTLNLRVVYNHWRQKSLRPIKKAAMFWVSIRFITHRTTSMAFYTSQRFETVR